MSIEQSLENVLSSMSLDGVGGKVSNFVVAFASDLAQLFTVLEYMAGLIGFFVFVWAFFDFKALRKANSPGVTGGGIAMKLIFASVMGTFMNFMKAASISFVGSADPTSPLSYIEKANSVQAVSPFTAMILAVLAIITLLGWFYGLKSVYLFATVNGRQDRQAHISQAAYMLVGSVIMVNLGLATIDFFKSGGIEIESFGSF